MNQVNKQGQELSKETTYETPVTRPEITSGGSAMGGGPGDLDDLDPRGSHEEFDEESKSDDVDDDEELDEMESEAEDEAEAGDYLDAEGEEIEDEEIEKDIA